MNTMEWSDKLSSKMGIENYNHSICETPMGMIYIEWKSWTLFYSYDVMIEGEYIGTRDSIDDAKQLAIEYLQQRVEELSEFLKVI